MSILANPLCIYTYITRSFFPFPGRDGNIAERILTLFARGLLWCCGAVVGRGGGQAKVRRMAVATTIVGGVRMNNDN